MKTFVKSKHIHILRPAYYGKYSNKKWLDKNNRFRVADEKTDLDGTEYTIYDTDLFMLTYNGNLCTIKHESVDTQSHRPTTVLTRLVDIRKLVKRMNGIFETDKFGYKQIYDFVEESNK